MNHKISVQLEWNTHNRIVHAQCILPEFQVVLHGCFEPISSLHHPPYKNLHSPVENISVFLSYIERSNKNMLCIIPYFHWRYYSSHQVLPLDQKKNCCPLKLEIEILIGNKDWPLKLIVELDRVFVKPRVYTLVMLAFEITTVPSKPLSWCITKAE